MIPIIKNIFNKEKAIKVYPTSELLNVKGQALNLYKPLPTNFTNSEALKIGRLIKSTRIHNLIDKIEDLISKEQEKTYKAEALLYTLHKHCMILYKKYGGSAISLFYTLNSNTKSVRLSEKINEEKISPYLFDNEMPVNLLDIPELIDHNLPILYTFNAKNEIFFIEIQFISYKKN
jgi:hypothetical protein